MRSYISLFIFVVLLIPDFLVAQNMTLEELKANLLEEVNVIEDRGHMMVYEFDSVMIYLVTDVESDRMRLVAGVIEEEKLKKEDYKVILEANYDRALDAKYALSDGILWSVFVHPLSDLTPFMIKNGLYQVRNLVYTYGSSYSSTGLLFGGEKEENSDAARWD